MRWFIWLLEKLDLVLSWWERVAKASWIQWGVSVVTFYLFHVWAALEKQPLLIHVTVALVAATCVTLLFVFLPRLLRKIPHVPFGGLFTLIIIIIGYALFSLTPPSQVTSNNSNSDNSASQTPHFKIRLDDLYFSTNGTEASLLAAVVSVQNLGAPSPATEWKLAIKVGKREYKGEPFSVGGLQFIYTPGKCFSFIEEEDLTQKTAAPILSTDIVRGVLMFEFLGIPQEEIMREHAVIQLECEDFDRETSRGSLRISDATNSKKPPTGIKIELPSRCFR